MTRPWDNRNEPVPHISWLPHHVLYIEAANSLPYASRMAAYRDIAAMAGASWNQIMDKAKRLRAAKLVPAKPRRIMVIGCRVGRPRLEAAE